MTGRDNTAFGLTSSGGSALSWRKEPKALRTLKLSIITRGNKEHATHTHSSRRNSR